MKKNLITLSILTIALAGCDGISLNGEDNDKTNAVGNLTLSGGNKVGDTIMAEVYDYNGTSNTISYTWSTNSGVIAGAEGANYVLTNNEVGSEITVTASYTDDDGHKENLLAKTTEVVEIVVIPNNLGTISLSGTPKVGSELTATVADTDGISTTINYEWQAGGVAIAGATTNKYTLTAAEIGKKVKVIATYTDDMANAESLTSNETVAITDVVLVGNDPGIPSLNKVKGVVVGDVLTMQIIDSNGATGTINYQWKADGVDIAGATSASYTVAATDLGKVLSATAAYTDDGSNAENLSISTTDKVFSTIVGNGAELVAAVANAAENDWIALGTANGGTYDDMPEINVAVKGVTLTRTADSTAVITGKTCVALTADNVTVDGLVFEDNDVLVPGGASGDNNCDASSATEAMLMMNADNVTVRNTVFKNHVGTVGFDWIELKGTNSTIERNSFSGSNTDNDKSGAISVYVDTSDGKNENNTIQYNYFTNFKPATEAHSGAYVIQLGRSTGNDSTGQGKHTIQYNLFDSIEVKERLIKVQASNNTLKGNTIVDSIGMISLEDGAFNLVRDNVVIPTGDDNDGAIAFTNLGHTITNNYIENVATTSGDRGALFIHAEFLKNSGSSTIIANNIAEQLKVVISNNTVFNSTQGITFDDKDNHCTKLAALLDVKGNLIAAESANSNGAKSEAVVSSDYEAAGCALNAASTHTDNHFFVNTLTDATIDFSNISGALDAAELNTPNAQGLISGKGAQANIGADLTTIHKLSVTDVGPNSTWSAN